MSARQPAGRFVLAPVVAGVVAWEQATPLIVAPIRLSSPVHVVLLDCRPGGAR